MRVIRQKRLKKVWKVVTDEIQTEVDVNTDDIDDNAATILTHDIRLITLEP